MTSFADIERHELKTDCRYYTGYKPCNKFDGCPECPHYAPRGEQILIIKLGAMGDVLRCKAILPALKREHSNSWIVWLTDPGSEVLARDPLVDEVRAHTPVGLAALEGRRFARLICLDKDAHAVALASRLYADRKQGFAPTPYNTITVWNEAAMYALRLGLSDDLKFNRNEKTMPEIVAEVAELPYNREEYGLVLSDDARLAASLRWREVVGSDSNATNIRTVGLNTGCGPVFATKGWTPENMAGLLKILGRHDDLRVVLLGGAREKPIHDALMAEAGPRVFDAGTQNPLEVFFGLVEKCDVVLSADSLAMHIAIALKRPVIAWFGPTCAQEIDLFDRGEKIVTDFACAPCYLKKCPKDVSCMEAMTPDVVYTSVKRVLGL